jgi:UDP-glucose 4-epimerase
MRCLVTGGLGFIGSHVVDALLQREHEVMVIDDCSTGTLDNQQEGATSLVLDLTTDEAAAAIAEQRPEWVFHLAALPRIQPSFDEPEIHEFVNVTGTIRLHQTLAEVGSVKALVNSSSSAVYGNASEVPTTEAADIDPLSPYALQKYAAERYLHILATRSALPVVSLRYFNPYGPRSYNPANTFAAYSPVLGIFGHQVASGSPVTVTGDGSQRRDFVHVTDVAAANVVVAENIERSRDEVYNVGTGVHRSILEVAQVFSEDIEHIEARQGEALITCADPAKLRTLGWEPRIELADAVDRGLL